jgi:hypothetical protein
VCVLQSEKKNKRRRGGGGGESRRGKVDHGDDKAHDDFDNYDYDVRHVKNYVKQILYPKTANVEA